MKKVFVLFLATVMIFTLAGCFGYIRRAIEPQGDNSPQWRGEEPGEQQSPYDQTQAEVEQPEPQRAEPGSYSIPGPADVLPRLERAFNNQDLFAIIECFEPIVSNMLFGTMSLAIAVAGGQVGPDALAAIMPFASQALGASGIMGDWSTVSLTPLSDDISGSSASLTYNVALTHTDGSRSSFDETILTTYIDGVWYIAAFQPVWEASDPVTAREVLAEPYTGKLFAAMQGGRWGFVDEYDNVVIPFEYLEAGEFSGGLARVGVSSGDMWGTRVCGFINTRNEFVVDPIYDYAGDFKDGLAPVNVGGTRDMGALRRGQWGFIDTTGRVVIPIKYNDFGEPAEGLVALKDGMYWGFVDMRGNTVIDFMFDWVGRGGDNFFSALGPSTLRSMISFGRNGHVGVSVNNAFGIIYIKNINQSKFTLFQCLKKFI